MAKGMSIEDVSDHLGQSRACVMSPDIRRRIIGQPGQLKRRTQELAPEVRVLEPQGD